MLFIIVNVLIILLSYWVKVFQNIIVRFMVMRNKQILCWRKWQKSVCCLYLKILNLMPFQQFLL